MKVPKSLAIVGGDFHEDIAGTMMRAAANEAKKLGVAHRRLVTVSGSYELPIIVDKLMSRDDIDAVVVLGYIERGETLHGQIMGQVTHQAFIDLQLHHKKPIGIGIIGPGATREQAETRQEGYARAAVQAAVRNFDVLSSL